MRNRADPMRLSTNSQFQRGMTLFEVALSLVIMTFGVVSVLMLLPNGIKAQQMARFQIYAAAKAEEMIEQFNGSHSSSPAIDSEGLAMWDVPVAHKAQSWDLESKLSSHRFGIMPLPLELARRLDSDGDDIQEILDNGGYVYYSQPLASTGTTEQGAAVAPPNEAQKLIIGVKGFAQQNCLSSFPLKNWPYHTPYPSPPVSMQHMPDKFLPPRDFGKSAYYNYYSWPWMDIEEERAKNQGWGNWSENHYVPWETSPGNTWDADIQKVLDWPDDAAEMQVPDGTGTLVTTKVHCGYFPYACGRLDDHTKTHVVRSYMPIDSDVATLHPTHLGPTDLGAYPSRPGVLRYVAAAIWYAEKKNFPWSSVSTTLSDPYADFKEPAANDKARWIEVQVYRFLAHSTTCLTSWYSYGGTEMDNLTDGVRIPEISLAGVKAPTDPMNTKVTHDMVKFFHERSLYLINRFAASYPYDWSVPRPLNRVTMMDYPLLQSDLFTPALPFGMPITNNYPFGGTPARPLYDFNLYNNEDSNSGGISGTVTNTWSHIFGRREVDDPQQWRVLSPEPIRNVGVSSTFSTSVIKATMGQSTNVTDAPSYDATSHFGDISHYNLTAKFSADERCRELVFWAVDWQSYEDFETAPSAPVDASKYPIGGPRCNWHNSQDVNGPRGNHQIPTYANRSYWERMIDMEFIDQQLVTYRNPEKPLLYWMITSQPASSRNNVDPRTMQTGTDMTANMILNTTWGGPDSWRNYPDKGPLVEARKCFNGLYGADRNFNKKLDRGTVPKSVRLRAVQVARFNFYDPRVQAIVR